MPLSKTYSFSSERLTYRGITRDDAQRIVEWRNDPENYENFSESSQDTQPILLLTNNNNTDAFFNWLKAKEPAVVSTGESVDDSVIALNPRFAVSFNYRHILSQASIEALGCPIINVHCSVLPWNRGASPNFFSYYENTPKGVTVHELTAGLDKGGVLLQRVLPLSEDETFESSYQKLIECACLLLEEKWDELAEARIKPRPQADGGSYHTMADFMALKECYPFEWSERVCDWKKRYGLQ